MKGKIITVTVNPAIDLHLRADSLIAGGDNKATVERRDMGGKGVNVSRALKSLGLPSLCFVILGRENGAQFRDELEALGLSVLAEYVDGRVRENINIHTESADTVIATDGPRVEKNTVKSMENILSPHVSEGDTVIFSGRISDLSDKGALLDYLHRLKSMRVRLILDSKSLTAEDIKRLRPYLIKPNTDEAEWLLGCQVSAENVRAAAEGLLALGAEYVLLSMGGDGAVLAHGRDVYYAKAPRLSPISTTGAGDTALAGFIYATGLGMSDAEALRFAVAAGSAKCMTQGNIPPDPCKIKELTAGIKAVKL